MKYKDAYSSEFVYIKLQITLVSHSGILNWLNWELNFFEVFNLGDFFVCRNTFIYDRGHIVKTVKINVRKTFTPHGINGSFPDAFSCRSRLALLLTEAFQGRLTPQSLTMFFWCSGFEFSLI